MNLKDKKVAVIGMGNSGVNAACLLRDIGANVYVTEAADTTQIRSAADKLKNRWIAVEIGGHTKDFIARSELAVVSPGVEDSSPAIRWAKELAIPVISELELGFKHCKGKIIAITGTNGKSTVASLVGDILKRGGKDTVICGNIGNCLCGEISRIRDDTWVVLEVSSFQLEKITDFKPHIALILNITDDHLDRYRKFEDYFKEKLKIFANQEKGDILILNYDAGNLRDLKERARSRVLFYSKSEKVAGAYAKGDDIFSSFDGKASKAGSVRGMALKGIHNLENAIASSLIGALVGVRKEAITDAIINFNGLSHRFETVDVIGGVEYIDDSKGTTVDSTYRALESCARGVVLIAGGKDKNSDYTVIRDLMKRKVKYLILIGEAKARIREALGSVVKICEAKDMRDAVDAANTLANDGDIVLLSPMCSSFDMFKNYKERGDNFKTAVRSLKSSF